MYCPTWTWLNKAKVFSNLDVKEAFWHAAWYRECSQTTRNRGERQKKTYGGINTTTNQRAIKTRLILDSLCHIQEASKPQWTPGTVTEKVDDRSYIVSDAKEVNTAETEYTFARRQSATRHTNSCREITSTDERPTPQWLISHLPSTLARRTETTNRSRRDLEANDRPSGWKTLSRTVNSFVNKRGCWQ